MTMKQILSRIKNNASSIYIRYQDKTVPLMSVPAPVAVGYILEWLSNDIEEMEKGEGMKSFYQLNEEEQDKARKLVGDRLGEGATVNQVEEYCKQAWYGKPNENVVWGVLD